METFGTRIKHAREYANLTQEYVAHQLNITQQAYQKIETGRTKLSVDTLMQIARVLNVRVQTLFPEPPAEFVSSTSQETRVELTSTERDLYERLIAAKNDVISYLTSNKQSI